MDIKAAAREINNIVSMDMILAFYGYHAKHGFMPCPFHAEAQASLKIYPGGRGWYCFGCHRGGTPIDFVMEQEECNFRTAVLAIDGAFNLGLVAPQNPIDAERDRAKEREIDATSECFQKWCKLARDSINQELLTMTRRAMDLNSIPKASRSAPVWTEILELDDAMQYLEYLTDELEKFGREVAEWRTMKLRKLAKKAMSAC